MKKIYRPSKWTTKVEAYQVTYETNCFFDHIKENGRNCREYKKGTFDTFEGARNALIKKYADEINDHARRITELHQEIEKAKSLKGDQ